MADQKLNFNSRTIHGGQKPEETTGSVMPPIFQTSTYAQSAPGEHKGYEYSRSQNPTREALEKNIASLEGADYGLAFGSGLAAIDAILKMLEPGDEVISTNDLYGGTHRLFNSIFRKYGIKFHFVGMDHVSRVSEKVNAKTKLIWVETPTNPMMNVIDIQAMSKIAREAGALLVVDNTFATPYLQRPLEHGADVVMHSATKYLAGHSDVVLGTLAVKDQEVAEQLYFIQNSSGAVCGPMDSFLTLRGLKTLHVRVQRHCENGRAVAEYLRKHDAVEAVFWPGFEDQPQYEVAKRQMKDFGGMVSFRIKGDQFEDASRVVSALKVFTLAESLGGVESLAGHPASMTHASIPEAERAQTGVSNGLIRLSVGIEDVDDLLADLDQALKA
jgi:cystathionine beta-lyase